MEDRHCVETAWDTRLQYISLFSTHPSIHPYSFIICRNQSIIIIVVVVTLFIYLLLFCCCYCYYCAGEGLMLATQFYKISVLYNTSCSTVSLPCHCCRWAVLKTVTIATGLGGLPNLSKAFWRCVVAGCIRLGSEGRPCG